MYTLKEVANMLKIHYVTAFRFAQQGKIKAVKIGGIWRVSEEEIKRIKEGKQE